jgi:hypothetical protein
VPRTSHALKAFGHTAGRGCEALTEDLSLAANADTLASQAWCCARVTRRLASTQPLVLYRVCVWYFNLCLCTARTSGYPYPVAHVGLRLPAQWAWQHVPARTCGRFVAHSLVGNLHRRRAALTGNAAPTQPAGCRPVSDPIPSSIGSDIIPPTKRPNKNAARRPRIPRAPSACSPVQPLISTACRIDAPRTGEGSKPPSATTHNGSVLGTKPSLHIPN